MSPLFGKLVLVICILLINCLLVAIIYSEANADSDYDEPQTLNHGHVRQHGVYWAWYNYFSASDKSTGNDSITLTTHGTFMDLGLLPNLLKRWRAPISLTLYVNGEDYAATISALKYLSGCMGQGTLMRRYVSIHIVAHSDNIPGDLQKMNIWAATLPDFCNNEPSFINGSQLLTYWYRRRLSYPVNLMRNVARINARTYYILALDLQLLPSPKFADKFLRFTWNHDTWRYADIPNPFTTVFCLPTFEYNIYDPLPYTKYQLFLAHKEMARPYHSGSQLRAWLNAPNPKEEIFIYSRSKQMNMCVGYVSINQLEPLYDERCMLESIYEKGANLKGLVLRKLNYTFITLDGAFLLRYSEDSWKGTNLRSTSRNEMIIMSRRWYIFYNHLLR